MKDRPTWEVVKAKARLVALGSLQREVVDHLDTFYPTSEALSIRLISALATKLDPKLTHLDT